MRAVDRVAAALAGCPGRCHDLLVGTPPFAPPPELAAACVRAAGEGRFEYGPAAGLPELRTLLARLGGDRADPRRVVVTHGAKGGLLAVLATLVEPLDEVVHPVPCYPAYPDLVRRLGGVPVAVPEHGDGFAGWPEAVAARLGPRTRAVVLSSPSNPTGTTLRPGVAGALVAACRERGVRLVVDEAYVDFAATAQAHDLGRQGPGPETVVRIRSASKSWAVPGWRLGWVVADVELAQRVAARQAALLNPPGATMQRALLALDEVDPGFARSARSEVRTRLGQLSEALAVVGMAAGIPEGGFYLWLDLRSRVAAAGRRSSLEWCVDRAARRGVALWPGEDFGAPGWARLAPAPGDGWRSACADIAARLVDPA